MARSTRLAIRWTIGDVNRRGFEALRLSVWGAWKQFGNEATYTICVNTIPLARAQTLSEGLPNAVRWLPVTESDIPSFLGPYLDGEMAEGVAWKFSPVRLYPDHYELSLDNDCILWDTPAAIRRWLDHPDDRSYVLAEDVKRCLGTFSDLCASGPRNTGIRGLPPGLDFAQELRDILKRHPSRLTSELDEQGLQVAALQRSGKGHVVTVDEVSICSPFPPHVPHLGRCGAHFVGLNAKDLPWSFKDRPAVAHIADHWEHHRETLYDRIGIRRISASDENEGSV